LPPTKTEKSVKDKDSFSSLEEFIDVERFGILPKGREKSLAFARTPDFLEKKVPVTFLFRR